MKLATKIMAHEIADQMSSANHGINLKKKMKKSIFEIAKKIAKKAVRNNKRIIKKEAKIFENIGVNHGPVTIGKVQNGAKPKAPKK